jgi:ribosomal protein S27E
MPTTFQCPACGGIIEYSANDQEMTCPFCGTAITTPAAGSAATVIMPKVEPEPAASAKTIIQQQSKFTNSAEIIDEVKRSLREGDKEGAVRIYSKEFNVPMIDAQASVDQIEIDMKHSGKEAAPEPEPIPAPAAPVPSAQQIPHFDVLDAPALEEKKSNTTRNWVIGCSIAFVLFCCICVILPTAVWFATGANSNFGN